MSAQALVERVMSGGIPDQATAERALRAVLSTLGERLTEDEAHVLATRLPADLARVVDESDYDLDFDAGEFYERTRLREHTTPGLAREHADVVLRVVGEALGEVSSRIVRALPADIGRQLVGPDDGEPPPHAPPPRASHLSTLAHGRPGSAHPLSEAAPSAGHQSSVARSDDPHGETKLSSGRGLTQERLRETLATGRPPQPLHPIAETDDDEPGER